VKQIEVVLKTNLKVDGQTIQAGQTVKLDAGLAEELLREQSVALPVKSIAEAASLESELEAAREQLADVRQQANAAVKELEAEIDQLTQDKAALARKVEALEKAAAKPAQPTPRAPVEPKAGEKAEG
jgi:chromosome segregation ATPase